MFDRLRRAAAGSQGSGFCLAIWYDEVVGDGELNMWTKEINWWQALLVIACVALVVFLVWLWVQGPGSEYRARIVTACAFLGLSLFSGSSLIAGGLSRKYRMRNWVRRVFIVGPLILICLAAYNTYCFLHSRIVSANRDIMLMQTPFYAMMAFQLWWTYIYAKQRHE